MPSYVPAMPRTCWTRAIALAMAFLVGLSLGPTSPASGAPIASIAAVSQALAQSTPVCGTISSDTTWTAASSPYQVTCNVTVAEGVTLTVEPGVEVDFSGTRGLYVNGTIVAAGTADHPILFTSLAESPGDWIGITVTGTESAFNAGSTFEYTTVEYGAYPNGDANLNVYYASVTIRHSTFRYSYDYGIATGNTGWVDVSDSTFTGNRLGALYFGDPSADQELTNLTIQDNGTGGDTDVVVIGGGEIHSAVEWQVPAPEIPYIVKGYVTVASGGVLTVDPGVEVQFQGYGITAREDGQLIADGTPAQPILFTGVTKTPGSWDGVRFSGTAAKPNLHSRLRYVTIEYGGASGGNVFMEWAYPLISHCTLSHSLQYGIYGRVIAGPRVSYTTISNGADYAIYIHETDYNPQFDHLTATDNGPSDDRNVIAFGGGHITSDAVWSNAGLPYVLLGGAAVNVGSTLTIEPGVEMRFDQTRGLSVYGRLIAVGTPGQPITFTGTTATEGWWDGIRIEGYENAPSTGSKLDHVTVEYGGYGYADIYTFWGQVAISHTIIRLSAKDGVFADVGGDAVSISTSQIVQNQGYGVRNDDPLHTTVLAANNWWGDASGPMFGGLCGGGGTGSLVSGGVDFAPVLADPEGQADPLSPSTLFALTLEPDRWFVPADGVMVSVIKATLRDGAGQPVSGRTILANTSRGTVTAGGITGVTGSTYILVKSNTPGDATVTAKVDQTAHPCDLVRSASTEVTFTPWAAGEMDLTSDAASPYTSAAISVGPQPLMVGTPALVSATLTNPYDHPILLNAVLGVSQSGIGLTHGPIKQWQDVRIEAHADLVLTATYTPVVVGHWCFYLDYSWYEPGSAAEMTRATISSISSVTEAGSASEGSNTNSQPAPSRGDEMRAAFGIQTKKLDLRTFEEPTTPPSSDQEKKNINRQINDSVSVTRDIGNAMRGDPPSQDYHTIVRPVRPVMPVYHVGDAGLTAAQADVLNTLFDAFADAIANGRAVLASDDRYAGAAANGDQTWEALQMAAILHYQEQMGLAYLRVADALEQWLNVYAGDHVPSVADVAAYQQQLATSGFSTEEIARYTALGCSAEDIEWLKDTFLAQDPAEMAISVRTEYAEAIVDYRTLGNLLAHPAPAFSQQVGSVSARMGALSSDSANLASFGEIEQSIEIGNPLAITATVELEVRRLGMPVDWGVALSSTQLTLGPGEHRPVTVRISPAPAVVQGTVPRMAVEGYVGDELLGGVEFRVAVPSYTPFAMGLQVFLPLVLR